jgi:hypothetical protein
VLVRELTVERVSAHFRGMITGSVVRYDLPNLHALNFLLHGALDGGGNFCRSRRTRRARCTPPPCCRVVLDLDAAEVKARGLPAAGD